MTLIKSFCYAEDEASKQEEASEKLPAIALVAALQGILLTFARQRKFLNTLTNERSGLREAKTVHGRNQFPSSL